MSRPNHLRLTQTATAALTVLALSLPSLAEPPTNRQGWDPRQTSESGVEPEAIVSPGPVTGLEGPTEAEIRLPVSDGPLPYTSREGRFTTTFPGACASLALRTNAAAVKEDSLRVRLVSLSCEGAGVSVVARLGAARGLAPRAAGEAVVAEVRRLQAEREAVPVQQSAIHLDFGAFGPAEGLDVQARPRKGKGELRIRGLLCGQDMYFLVAWSPQGGVFATEQYDRFFADFKPWAP